MQTMGSKMLIEFYGLRRSGNHACLEWIKDSLDPTPETQRTKLKILYTRGNLAFVNEANLYGSPDLIRKLQKQYDIVILGYEDAPLSFSLAEQMNIPSKKIVLIRDFENLCASRIKAIENDNQSAYILNAMRLDNHFVNMYSSYLSVANLVFEDWLFNDAWKKQFLEDLGAKNSPEIKGKPTNFGGGSSFSGLETVDKNSLLERKSLVKLPNYLQAAAENIKKTTAWQDKLGAYYAR